MILVISAQEPTLDSPKDDRFGRCKWLIKFNTETNEWHAFENPGANQSGGAGVAAAQFVVDQKVDVVISGDFGPHAAKAFLAATIGMQLFTDDVVTVREAVDHYTGNELTPFQ